MMRHSAATALLVCVSAGLSVGTLVVSPSFARAEIAAQSEACAAWPGEIDPLPRVDSADPISARWARERAKALAADARLVETMSLQEARRYWQHVLCLDPYSDAGRAGMFRTGPFRVSGPVDIEPGPPSPSVASRAAARRAELETQELTNRLNPMAESGVGQPPTPPKAGPQFAARSDSASTATQFTPKPAPALTPEDTRPESRRQPEATRAQAMPYDSLPAPPVVDSVGQASAPSLTSVDQELGEIETLVAEAHFHTALSVAKATRGLLVASAATDAVALRRARLEVLAATAAVALGRDAEALVNMSDALRANPELQLDTATTSPKVVAILDEARRSLRPGRPARLPSVNTTTTSADIGAVQ